MLNNWLRWTAANSAGGVKTQEAQAEMQKIQKLIEEHTKKTELPGILAQELAARNFDEAKLQEIADSVNAADPVGSLQQKLVDEGVGGQAAKMAATKIIKTLSERSAQVFNEHFEKMAEKYYTDSFVDPLSKTNIAIDAFAAAIGGPQSLFGHFFGAWYRNVKADTLKGKAKGMYDELEKSFKGAQDKSLDGGAGSVNLTSKKRGLGDDGGAGPGDGGGLVGRSRVVGAGGASFDGGASGAVNAAVGQVNQKQPAVIVPAVSPALSAMSKKKAGRMPC